MPRAVHERQTDARGKRKGNSAILIRGRWGSQQEQTAASPSKNHAHMISPVWPERAVARFTHGCQRRAQFGACVKGMLKRGGALVCPSVQSVSVWGSFEKKKNMMMMLMVVVMGMVVSSLLPW
uniref:Uncharacterized protein n=1 Tax=Knipowitschia caucasica TaxID=637954 RepID=A0AAV2JI63_KNICA